MNVEPNTEPREDYTLDAARDALCVMIEDATGFDGLCSWRASKAGRRSFRLKGEA